MWVLILIYWVHFRMKESLPVDIKSLSRKTGVACQVLRALQQTIIGMTAASETDLEWQNTCTRFSTGYAALDSALYGGFEFGQIIEIYGCTEKSQFVLQTMASFLQEHPDAVVHHIDTLGTFQPRRIGDQSQQASCYIDMQGVL
ncbi:hypothetical protein BDB00DRAFT_867119 [Zychaea mexicana]|uniref:uncharacterized protein n=1 Tax=Zychaea mexicana TaxID=64656 RepID=UPI0022FE179A|nr:uncharacterized protein BDB00DRAFT_867119 [Zychaea mexicana]KAI9499045.1 hypothetical protein BDB00DRAFT_867119 [Zychaea mexicana]